MDKQFLEIMNLKFIIALYDYGGLIIFIKVIDTIGIVPVNIY